MHWNEHHSNTIKKILDSILIAMIKNIFRSTSRLLASTLRHPPYPLYTQPRFYFCQQRVDAILDKLKSGVEDPLLKEISELN